MTRPRNPKRLPAPLPSSAGQGGTVGTCQNRDGAPCTVKAHTGRLTVRERGSMTVHNTSEQEARPFRTAAEVQREPRPEQTEAEIEAWIEAEIRADKKTLDLLATL